MATRFIEEATSQLAPVYQQQQDAISAQVPAIQNLYNTLLTGLEGQRQTETQNILESASSRGVLRSSLPVDLQTALGSALLQERGKLESQRAGEIAGVNEKLGGLGVNRANAIADLARSLESQDIEQQKLAMARIQADRDYQIQQAQLAVSRSKGGGGTARAPTQAQIMQSAASALANELRGVAGADGYVSPQDYAAGRQEWMAAGFSAKSYDSQFSGFKNPQNKNYQYF